VEEGHHQQQQYSPFRRRREKADCKRERGRRVLMAEGFDTKLRIIKRLKLLINQLFLYIYVRARACKAIDNTNNRDYNKKIYL